ncbi:MAG: hypothetical protein QUV06_07585 [Cyanobium sp. CZS 48M]|nr:hypothetical protein [Cyanobium sp. CZS48M]
MIYLHNTNILIYMIKNRPPQVAGRIDQLTGDDSLALADWAGAAPQVIRMEQGQAIAGEISGIFKPSVPFKWLGAK